MFHIQNLFTNSVEFIELIESDLVIVTISDIKLHERFEILQISQFF